MTENKPQPLDLRDIEKKIEELAFEVDQVIDWKVEPKGEWDEDTIKNIVRRDVKIFSHVDYAVELRDIEELFQEIKQRIKSAVRGLLKEIEELIIGWQEAMGKEEMNKAYGNGAIRSLIDAKNLIKKWFPDVLRGDKNEKK